MDIYNDGHIEGLTVISFNGVPEWD